jgi:hypothetical protein
MQDKIVYARVSNSSFDQGSEDMARLAVVDEATKQVERVCQRIGDERVAERNEAVAAYQALQLAERKPNALRGVTRSIVALACRSRAVTWSRP